MFRGAKLILLQMSPDATRGAKPFGELSQHQRADHYVKSDIIGRSGGRYPTATYTTIGYAGTARQVQGAMMNKIVGSGILLLLALSDVEPGVAQALPKSDSYQMLKMNDAKFKDWLLRWERNILSENSMHYCSSEMGEEIGWKMSPFFRGFYYGYLATGNILWVDRLVACTDAWIKRAVKEPDGYPGLAQGWCCGYQGRQSR